MMQNSLDRLFEGAVATLLDTVLPAVDDDYVRSQVRATAELLANVATRVEWSCAQLREDTERTRDALRAVLDAAPPEHLVSARDLVATDLPDDNAGLVATRVAHLAELADAQRWLDGAEGAAADRARAAVSAFTRARLDTERARLRTGMYS